MDYRGQTDELETGSGELMKMDKIKKASEIDQLAINTIRFLSIDAVQKANSGHPGAPMGMAPAVYVLWDRFLKHNPNPKTPDGSTGTASYCQPGMPLCCYTACCI